MFHWLQRVKTPYGILLSVVYTEYQSFLSLFSISTFDGRLFTYMDMPAKVLPIINNIRDT